MDSTIQSVQRAFPRSLDQLAPLVQMTDEFFQRHGLDPAKRNLVDLCLEELFVNMVTYDTECTKDIQVALAPADHGGVEVTITASGVARFDPTAQAPAVDPDAPADAREPGGLGLYLVLKMVDSIHYDYAASTSRITFIAGRDNGAAPTH